MSEERVPREAVEETQDEPATTDQPGAGPADSPHEDDREDTDRERDGGG